MIALRSQKLLRLKSPNTSLHIMLLSKDGDDVLECYGGAALSSCPNPEPARDYVTRAAWKVVMGPRQVYI